MEVGEPGPGSEAGLEHQVPRLNRRATTGSSASPRGRPSAAGAPPGATPLGRRVTNDARAGSDDTGEAFWVGPGSSAPKARFHIGNKTADAREGTSAARVRWWWRRGKG